MGNRLGRLLAAGAAVGALTVSLGLPTAARGSEVGVTGELLIYRGAAGEQNTLSVRLVPAGVDPAYLSVVDTGAVIGAGPGCSPDPDFPNGQGVRCDSGAITSYVEAGDGDDRLELAIGGRILAGDGNDTVLGGQSPDDVDGGPGNDSFRAATGGANGNDAFAGGTGRDTADYSLAQLGVSVSLDGVANDGEPGEQDNILTDVEDVVGSRTADALTGNAADNLLRGLEGNDVLAGGAGNDGLDGGGDGGNDNLLGGDGDDGLHGGPGDDALNGGAGADGLDGVDGNDGLSGGPGPDNLSGGPGSDTADYSGALGPVSATLDDVANDGEPGELDNVRSDVEGVRGGRAADTFTGSAAGNPLVGGGGEDYLDGRLGIDDLQGGDDIDVIRARDGLADVIDCGQGRDFAILDRSDRVVRACERRDTGRARPRLGRQVVARPVRGTNAFGLPGMDRTVPLQDRLNLPVSSRLDATSGRISLVSARPRRRGRSARQSATFYDGAFSVRQRRSGGVTEVRLSGGDFSSCRTSTRRSTANSAATRRRTNRRRANRRTVRRLWGRGKGRWRTRGRYSAVTVRGTVWSVLDRCDGTLTRVKSGRAVVYDFRRRRAVTLRAGQRYLARARR